MQKISIGIIGFGRIGNVHLQNLLRNNRYTVKYVCDIKPIGDFNKKYPEITYVQDYHEILQDQEVDAVLIGTPTNLHPEMIMEAAKAEKHILCEKPIGFDLHAIMDAYHEVQQHDIIFQLGFNRRFDDDFLNIRNQIEKIGKPQILKITSRDPEVPPIEYVKNSGGIFMDMAIHDFDMARYMFGEVEEVYVNGATLINPEISKYGDIDTAIISLKFENDSIGVIDNSRQAVYGYDQRLEVFGSEGMLHNTNHLNHNTTFSARQGVQLEKPMYFFLERYKQSYATEMEYFADSILTNAPIACTITDGIMAVKIAQAAAESFATGKAVSVKKIFNGLF